MHSGERREKHGKHLLEQQLSIMAVMLHSIFIDIVINAVVSSLDEKFSFHSWMDTTFLMSSGGGDDDDIRAKSHDNVNWMKHSVEVKFK